MLTWAELQDTLLNIHGVEGEEHLTGELDADALPVDHGVLLLDLEAGQWAGCFKRFEINQIPLFNIMCFVYLIITNWAHTLSKHQASKSVEYQLWDPESGPFHHLPSVSLSHSRPVLGALAAPAPMVDSLNFVTFIFTYILVIIYIYNLVNLEHKTHFSRFSWCFTLVIIIRLGILCTAWSTFKYSCSLCYF